MNTRMNSLLKTALRSLSVLLFVLVIPQLEEAYAQTFKLEGREYRLIDGKWYNFSSGQRGDKIVPERLIVRLRDRGDLRRFNFAQVGLANIRVISDELFGGYYVVKVEIPQDPFAVATALSENPLFDYVEFDAIGEYHKTPNDPLYPNQWNLPKISMPSTWDITTGSNSIILAIIDSGTDYNHEDLDGNIWSNADEQPGDANGDGFPGVQYVDDDGDGLVDEDSQGREPWDLGYTNDLRDDDDENGYVDDFRGWDFYDNDNSPSGTNPHGTAVAGIAVAQTNNYEGGSYRGVAGVAGGWGTSHGVLLMVLRNGDDYPSPTFTASALRYAARNGARVVNMSFGFSTDYQYVRTAVDSAANVYNCVLVASAGNNGGNGSSDKSIRYPAKYSTTIAVGATIQDDSRWVTIGTSGSAIGPELDVVAPGGAPIIYTTDITGSAGYDPGNYYCCFGGTSAAAPHVSGLAALIRSKNSTLTWQQVWETIRLSADKVSGMGGQNFTNEYGYGRINANKAVRNLYVPQVYTTISSALNVATSGQTVVVSSGPIPKAAI